MLHEFGVLNGYFTQDNTWSKIFSINALMRKIDVQVCLEYDIGKYDQIFLWLKWCDSTWNNAIKQDIHPVLNINTGHKFKIRENDPRIDN